MSDESIDKITDALLTASRLLVAISARSIGHVDESITVTQFRTLVILATRGPLKVAAVAGILDVAPSTTTRMVERLVSRGLLTREPHPLSRRELVLDLTDRGRRVVDEVSSQRRREIAAVVERIPEADRQGLVHAVTAFTAAGGEPPYVGTVNAEYQL